MATNAEPSLPAFVLEQATEPLVHESFDLLDVVDTEEQPVHTEVIERRRSIAAPRGGLQAHRQLRLVIGAGKVRHP